jgi:hypothetical protein
VTAQEDQSALMGFIEWLGLEGDEAESFLKEAMTKRGHKPMMTWADSDGKEKNSGGTVLGMRSSSGKKAAGGSGWQYGG